MGKTQTHDIDDQFLAKSKKAKPEAVSLLKSIQDKIGFSIKAEIIENNIEGFGDPTLRAVGSIPFKCDKSALAKVKLDLVEDKLKEFRRDRAQGEGRNHDMDRTAELQDVERSVLALCMMTKREPGEVTDLLSSYLKLCKTVA